MTRATGASALRSAPSSPIRTPGISVSATAASSSSDSVPGMAPSPAAASTLVTLRRYWHPRKRRTTTSGPGRS